MLDAVADNLSLPINAWGTPTPYGVSRSSSIVASAVAQALQRHVDMSVLQRAVAHRVNRLSGAEAACFCHCASAGITLAVAGALGGESNSVAQLPRTSEEGVVAIQSEHCINYGQPVVQAIRLAGAQVLSLSGSAAQRLDALSRLCRRGVLRAILFVESSLVRQVPTLFRKDLYLFAKENNVRFFVDAAAQDWRMNDHEFLSEADLTIFSAQKYLAGPTCGVLVGKQRSVDASSAHLAGIGRSMKPTKEALFGLAAAIDERDWSALPALKQANFERARKFARSFLEHSTFRCTVTREEIYGPYPRVLLDFAEPWRAVSIAEMLLDDPRPIVTGRNQLDRGVISIELTHVDDHEERYLLDRLRVVESIVG